MTDRKLSSRWVFGRGGAGVSAHSLLPTGCDGFLPLASEKEQTIRLRAQAFRQIESPRPLIPTDPNAGGVASRRGVAEAASTRAGKWKQKDGEEAKTIAAWSPCSSAGPLEQQCPLKWSLILLFIYRPALGPERSCTVTSSGTFEKEPVGAGFERGPFRLAPAACPAGPGPV